uniref:ArsR family transcriptional regulator n=2 Tax=Ignisphaera aggregans TaxID=334771 RepID=A0A7J3JTM5_9CREN
MSVDESAVCNIYRRLLHQLVKSLENDLRMMVVIELLNNGPLSFRALGRRLRVNYRRLNEALRHLASTGIIQVYTVKISPTKSYRFYHVSEAYLPILKTLLIVEDREYREHR